MRAVPPHLLVLEPDARGHAAEWIGHIARLSAGRADGLCLTFAVPRSLADRLESTLPNHARLVALGAAEHGRCLRSSPVLSGIARWRTMRRYLTRVEATHGLFLGLDHAILPAAFRLGTGKRPVSGILFRPTAHYGAIGSPATGWRERLRRGIKATLLRAALGHRHLHTVFSLDPYFPGFASGRWPGGEKVLPVGDPAFPRAAPNDDAHEIVAGVPAGRRLIVLFGEITARKGVQPLLRALAALPPEACARLAVIVAGRIAPEIAVDVGRLATTARWERSDLWLRTMDRWLSAGELTALVDGCDMVLAPYQDFVGSSGVLLWAAQSRRPVLCQSFGLIGRLTNAFGLGLTANTGDPMAIAQALQHFLETDPSELVDPDGQAAFVAERTPERFVEAILDRCALMPDHDVALGRAAAQPPEQDPPRAPLPQEWSQRFPG